MKKKITRFLQLALIEIKNLIRLEANNNSIVFLKRNKNVFFAFVVGIIFVDSFFVRFSYDFLIFLVLLCYLVYIKLYKTSSRLTFIVSLGLLVAMFFSYLFTRTSPQTEKLAVWLFLFLIVGIIQGWRE